LPSPLFTFSFFVTTQQQKKIQAKTYGFIFIVINKQMWEYYKTKLPAIDPPPKLAGSSEYSWSFMPTTS
jgi:hypothetical protein